MYDCCGHCEHGPDDLPHMDPCPDGCNDEDEP